MIKHCHFSYSLLCRKKKTGLLRPLALFKPSLSMTSRAFCAYPKTDVLCLNTDHGFLASSVKQISEQKLKMKLLSDSSIHPDTLLCQIVGSILGFPITWSKTPGLMEPELVLTDPDSFSITSSYAITTYLVGRAAQNKTAHHLLPVRKSKQWVHDDMIVWVITHLIPNVHGVNKDAAIRALDALERRFLSSTSGYCISDSLSLVDLFVWSALRTSAFAAGARRSRVFPVLEEITSSCPRARRHSLLVESDARVQQALNDYYSGVIPTCYSSPCSPLAPKKKFYITTAINYTNGAPHMGHAYEAIITDIIARFHRVYGHEVMFVTGTDEHGQKIATTAEKLGKTPLAICDYYADEFKKLDKLLNISYDLFIRTTSPEHHAVAQKVWELSRENGDIYLGTYEGWYNVREETFVAETEAKASDYKDPISGVPLQKMKEASYFFKLSKYQQKLIDHIQANPQFIEPSYRRNDILARLKQPLEDLSCSRTTFSWGIPVPDDSKHVMYVWFDALVNYISAIKFGSDSDMTRFWPADVHMIGKDITWFHCVIWPCMLMSIGADLPKTVFAHGFVLAKDGHKMSKSLDNVVDPFAILDTKCNSDVFRFYIAYAGEAGRDLRFDVEGMHTVQNSELADTIGNMVHRATGLCTKFCAGRVPDCSFPSGYPPFDFELLRFRVHQLMKKCMVNEALNVIMFACRDTNKYLTDKAPWALSDVEERKRVCRVFLEAVYYLAHFLSPFIPAACDDIFARLGTPSGSLRSLSGWYDNLKPDTPVVIGDVLFKKRETASPHSQPTKV